MKRKKSDGSRNGAFARACHFVTRQWQFSAKNPRFPLWHEI